MLKDDKQLPQPASGTVNSPSVKASDVNRPTLVRWLQQILASSQTNVKARSRGNNLYLLFESQPCPSAETIVQQLEPAFATTALEQFFAPNAPEVHRVICYGRPLGEKQPTWSREILLPHKSVTSNAQPGQPNAPESQRSHLSSTLERAKGGDPKAIAHLLSFSLSGFGIGIRAKLDTSPAAQASDLKRLLVLCESGYTPDASLLAEPIAQQLRELELMQFRDAVVFGQVSGEQRPEWMVRVDLTPPDDFLREWARWGDVQAITRLSNRALAPYPITVTALLKDVTLHLSCTASGGTGAQVPVQEATTEVIVPLLKTLSPQGIQSAIIYGVSNADPNSRVAATSGWVHLVELAAPGSELAQTTLELAKQGDLRSLTFLLTRLLNPNLDEALATGGIQVQVRWKGDLLHILTEAPNCSRQDAVVGAVIRCLKPLQIASVSGVRLYGRRSGQKQPLWSYGTDFAPRQRLVPEATPEFAASAAHVDELLSPPGELVLWSDLPADDVGNSVKRLYDQIVGGVQRSLIRTQVFVPIDNPAASSSLVPVNSPSSAERQRLKTALLCGAIGTLFVLQADWLLGFWVRSTTQQATEPAQLPAIVSNPKSSLPNVNLSQTKHGKNFDSAPFTHVAPETVQTSAGAPLTASPLQPTAESILAQGKEFPSFNSRQLDRQVELYRRYLEINGAPDVLIVGSSRALRGVDPVALKTALAKQGYNDVQIFNFGINGATAQAVDLVVRQMLPQDKLPKLILFADGARAFNSGRHDITFNGVVASEGYQSMVAGKQPIPSTVVAQVPNSQAGQAATDNPTPTTTNVYQQWNDTLNQRIAAFSMVYATRDRLKAQLREQFTALLPDNTNSVVATTDIIDTSPSASASGTAIGEGDNGVDINGFLPLSVRFNPVTYYQKYARVQGDYDSDYEAFNLQGTQTEAMIALSQYAQLHKIPLVFVNLPLTQEYLDPIRKRHEDDFQQHMLRLATQTGFTYRNLNNVLLTQSQYFSDPSHLNRYGAYEVSHRLAQDVMIPWQVTRQAKK